MDQGAGIETLQRIAVLFDAMNPRLMTTEQVAQCLRKISVAIRAAATQKSILLEILHRLEVTQSKQLQQIEELTQRIKTMEPRH